MLQKGWFDRRWLESQRDRKTPIVLEKSRVKKLRYNYSLILYVLTLDR